MDQVIEKPRGLSRRAKVLVSLAGGLLIALALLWPVVRRWARAERSVDLARLQVATVVRGDLERDVAAQGRIVAANHPKLYSPSQGIVALAVKPGEAVRAGQVLAAIASLAALVVISQFVARRVTAPLDALVHFSQEVGAGSSARDGVAGRSIMRTAWSVAMTTGFSFISPFSHSVTSSIGRCAARLGAGGSFASRV